MRTMMMAAAAAVALVASAAAQADPPAPVVQSAGAQPGERLICRYFYHNGTLVRRQVCKTEREWTRERSQRQADFNELQMRSLTMEQH